MEERRKFPRLDLNVEVNWKRNSASPSVSAGNIANTKNISAGGVCLISDECLNVGQGLSLEIKLPGNRIINAEGRVVWTDQFEIIGGKYEKKYGVGVEFVDIKDEIRTEINKFILSFQQIGA